ncbi:MAG: hypothetical protein AAGE88_18135 [Actinomycetota bacterium]
MTDRRLRLITEPKTAGHDPHAIAARAEARHRHRIRATEWTIIAALALAWLAIGATAIWWFTR